MRVNKTPLILVAAVLLSACSAEHLRKDFGNATAINKAAQAVNPAAGAGASDDQAIDGMKVEQGLRRYRADKPETTRAKLVSETGN